MLYPSYWEGDLMKYPLPCGKPVGRSTLIRREKIVQQSWFCGIRCWLRLLRPCGFPVDYRIMSDELIYSSRGSTNLTIDHSRDP